MNWIIIALVVFLISTLLTKWFAVAFKQSGIVDVPNERSSHTSPTPRGGGLAIIVAVMAGLSILFFSETILMIDFQVPGFLFWTGFLLIAATSLLDDKIGLPFYVRITLHFIAANLIFHETGGLTFFPLPEPFAIELGQVMNYTLTIFWILAVVNIYNFLDGIDGFAATQAIIAGSAMAIIDHNGPGQTIGILTASASLGFLIHNWRPAKIFMGDIGSAALGFIFATAPLYFSQIDTNLAVFSMGIFLWFFISDGAFTIIRRFVKGEKIWQAHRTHLYQRLVIAGLNHDKVATVIMLAATALCATFFLLYYFIPSLMIWVLIPALLAYVLYYLFVKNVVKNRVLKDM
jgi:Fuc2NAc and GlcNAc transferase